MPEVPVGLETKPEPAASPVAGSSRSAVFGVTPRRLLMIAFRRTYETPISSVKTACERPRFSRISWIRAGELDGRRDDVAGAGGERAAAGDAGAGQLAVGTCAHQSNQIRSEGGCE